MGRPFKYTDDQFADVLTECKGMTFVASRRLGCDHETMTKRIARSPRLQAIIAQQTGLVLDTVELKLFDAATSGDLGAMKYLLSTKGKTRGYVERQEVTGKDGDSLFHLSPEDIDRELAALLDRARLRTLAAPADRPALPMGTARTAGTTATDG